MNMARYVNTSTTKFHYNNGAVSLKQYIGRQTGGALGPFPLQRHGIVLSKGFFSSFFFLLLVGYRPLFSDPRSQSRTTVAL